VVPRWPENQRHACPWPHNRFGASGLKRAGIHADRSAENVRDKLAFPIIAKDFSPIRLGAVHVIVFSVALAACVDLTPPWSGHEDPGSWDAGAGQAGTGGADEVRQVDSGATEQTPSVAGQDAAVGQDSQDSSGANPDTATDMNTNTGTNTVTSTNTNTSTSVDASADHASADQKSSDANPDVATNTNTNTNIGTSVDASTDRAGAEGTMEVGKADSGATDQAAPVVECDAAPGQDGQDSSGAHPDAVTNADTNTGAGIVADGTYRVIARHSGKVLDVYGNATADGSNVDQWTYDGGKNRLWTLTHLGGNVYEILGVQSGKALEVATASTADDTNVDIRTYTGAANQKWTISALSGYFRLTPVSSSGSALDVGGSSTTDGANVHQWTWLGGDNYNQQWTFQAP
jgi:hypothetical protein